MIQIRQKVSIRRSTPADAKKIIDGINLICTEGGAFYTTRFVSSSTWETVLHQPHNVPDHLLTVAEQASHFVGSCRLFPGPKQSYCHHVLELGMFVLPPYRRQGIGRALLNWGIAWAIQQGFEKISLSVFANNKSAIGLYRSVGFIDEGVQKKQMKIGGEYIDLISSALWLPSVTAL